MERIYWIWIDENDPVDDREYRDIPIVSMYYEEYDLLVFSN